MASSFNTWKSVLLAQEMPAGADAAVARDFQRFLADNVCETDPTAAVVQSHARAIQQQIRDAEGLSMLAHHPEGKVVVTHHAVAQGGTTMQPDLRLGGLLGIDDVAQAMSLAQPSLLRHKEVLAPSVEAMLGAPSEAALTGLTQEGSNTRHRSASTKFKSLVLLPPSILQNVLEEHEASPWAILSAIKRRLDEDAGSDDASDSGDDEGHGAAGLRSNEAIQHVVKWLWFVATSEQGDIPAVSLHPTTDPALKTCAREMHARHITGASGDGPPAGGAPTDSAVATAANAMTRAASEASSLTGAVMAYTDKVDKKHSMNGAILKACAAFCRVSTEHDDDVAAIDSNLPEGLKALLEESNLTQAAVGLELHVKGKTGVRTSLQGLTTYVRLFGFGKSDKKIYDGFSVFAFSPVNSSSSNAPLCLAASQKKGHASTQVKALLKQNCRSPTECDGAKRHISAFGAGISFLAGEDSEPARYVDRVLSHMKTHEDQHRDIAESHGEKFWLAMFHNVDASIHAFWKACLRSPDDAGNDLSCFSMADESKKMMKTQNPFVYPSHIKLVQSADAPTPSSDSDSDKSEPRTSPKKKQKTGGASGRAHQCEHFVTFDINPGNFAKRHGKKSEPHEDRPEINGCKFCPPFILTGVCGAGSSCKLKKSHVKRPLKASERGPVEQHVEKCDRKHEEAEE